MPSPPTADARAGLNRRLLQVAVAAASLVPILAGGAGMILGPAMFGTPQAGLPSGLVSHTAYLSGLLLGIGLAYAATLPDIERHGARFRLLCPIVVLGGLGRAGSLLLGPAEAWTSYAALVMELAVTPALTLWQSRVAAQVRLQDHSAAP